MLLLVIHAGMKVAKLKKKYISVTHVSGYVNFHCNDCHLHIRMLIELSTKAFYCSYLHLSFHTLLNWSS